MKLITQIVLFITLIFSGGIAMAYEEPNYEVVHETNLYEIRHYKQRVVVQTKSYSENNGFRKLFNYISGSNQESLKISMTTPVTETKNDDESVMHFYLPSNFNQSNTPIPSDDNVQISIMKEEYLAVIKYSGRSTDSNFYTHLDILKKELINDEIELIGYPIKATYNGPFTPYFLRRNEAMHPVKWGN
ncbi:MAG: heme-binding protein [Hyphomicrobiales bacterium]|nr:heme-binding protein [Hyphomicrobiales bacterium]